MFFNVFIAGHQEPANVLLSYLKSDSVTNDELYDEQQKSLTNVRNLVLLRNMSQVM